MFLENLALALKAIWANKMRSLLTTLGIVIGTAAVIAVVSIVQGLSRVITSEIEGLGSTAIIISPNRPPGKEGEKLQRVELTWEDGLALLKAVPALSEATPVLQRFGKVKFGENAGDYPVLGVQPPFQDIRQYFV